jgi:hypothetical protein
MRRDQPLNAPELDRGESKVTRQRDRRQPELGRLLVSIPVNMGRLVDVMAHEIDAIRAAAQDRRRISQLASATALMRKRPRHAVAGLESQYRATPGEGAAPAAGRQCREFDTAARSAVALVEEREQRSDEIELPSQRLPCKTLTLQARLATLRP